MILLGLFTSEGQNFSQRIEQDFCTAGLPRLWAKKTASRETVGLLLAEGLHFCFQKQLVFYFLMTLRVWTLPSAWMSRMM